MVKIFYVPTTISQIVHFEDFVALISQCLLFCFNFDFSTTPCNPYKVVIKGYFNHLLFINIFTFCRSFDCLFNVTTKISKSKRFIIFFNQFRYNTTTSCNVMTNPRMTTQPEDLPTRQSSYFGVWGTGEPPGPPYCKDDELDYSNWLNSEPNNIYGGEDCVEFRAYSSATDGGVWTDQRCSYRSYFLCEKGKKQVST